MTLETYLRRMFSGNAIDHAMRAHVGSAGVRFYVHPQNTSGPTLDFEVRGNTLVPICTVGAEQLRATDDQPHTPTEPEWQDLGRP